MQQHKQSSAVLCAHPGSMHQQTVVCRKEILGLILVKELITIDQSKGLPLSHVRMRSLPFLRGDTAMYDLLKLFQTGRSHMVVLTQPPLEDDNGDAASVAVSRVASGDVAIQIEEAQARVEAQVGWTVLAGAS